MTADEIKQELATAFPSEIDGFKRPTAPIATDNVFYTDILPLIAKDPVLFSGMNLILSVLLSNDTLLKKWQEEIKKVLQDQDFDTVTAAKKGLMSPELFTKLTGIAEHANNYTHPKTHPADMITTDDMHQFVSAAQVKVWDGKASTNVVTTAANGLTPKLSGDSKQYFAGDGTYKALPTAVDSASMLTVNALGTMKGKTIDEFKTALVAELRKTPSMRMRLVSFSGELYGLIENWNSNKNDYVITDGTKNTIAITNAHNTDDSGQAYISLELWSCEGSGRWRTPVSYDRWYRWEKVVETSEGKLYADSAGTASRPNYINLAANADLNDLSDPAWYRAGTNALAATIKNTPVKVAFALEVYSAAYPVQRLTPYNAPQRTYIRYYNRDASTPAWSAWTLMTAANSNRVGGKTLAEILAQARTNGGGIVAGSLTETGWVKFANGLIIQWGVFNADRVTVKLPISFSVKAYVALSGPTYQNGDVNTYAFATKTEITLYHDEGGGLVQWLVIGV
ncbi:pyocin knob domain-containing protein [uncultured Megasphaera sp.]|uniref:pyocin knob domain-containing protein n=1 Tax=uncultured Megasphaera sp. TaxID=165188 RepID=UPI002598062F|nr:pyocin knob domain-containing protein [uncultured Megasphaera sp.]